MKLEDQLSEWDRKSIDHLENIYLRFHKSAGFVAENASLLHVKDLEVGASWLIKKHFETKNDFDKDSKENVFRSTPGLTFWEARLHILQCIPYLEIPLSQQERAETFIRKCLSDKTKFVRAWAYGGFYELGNQYPEYRDEIRHIIDFAMVDESASVKARVRNVVKFGFLSGH